MSSLKSNVLHSLKWVAISKLFIQTFRWISTFIVIRMLIPEDYAVIAISDMIAGYLIAFSTLGLGAILISRKTVDEQFKREMLTLSYLVNILLFIIQFFVAEHIASIYHNEAVEMVLKASALTYLLAIFTLLPSSLMVRKMEFKMRSLIEMGAGVVSTTTIILMASTGFGFWSLVAGYVVNEIIKTFLYFYLSNELFFIPVIPRKSSLIEMRYCLSVSLSELIFHIRDSVDLLIGGVTLSTAQIGVYNVALQVANMPLRKIAPPLRSVALPALSRVKDDKDKLFSYLTKFQRLGFFITIPIFWGISSTIDLILPVALGDQWNEAINVISLICLVLPFRFGEEMLHPILKSMQNGRDMLICNLAGLVFFASAIFAGIDYGLAGIALAWVISTPTIYFFSAYIISKAFNLPLSDFANQWIKPAFAGVVMIVSIEPIKELLSGHLHPLLILTVAIIVGAITFLTTSWLFQKSIFKEILSLRQS
jgi:O-antigen/teichoic acid export membrane protein